MEMSAVLVTAVESSTVFSDSSLNSQTSLDGRNSRAHCAICSYCFCQEASSISVAFSCQLFKKQGTPEVTGKVKLNNCDGSVVIILDSINCCYRFLIMLMEC